MAMSTSTRPILRAQFGKFGHESQVRVNLSLNEQLERAGNLTSHHPIQVVFGVEADMRGHDRQIQVLGRAGPLVEADPSALEICEAPDVLMHEQAEASGVHTRQHGDRHTGIEETHRPGRKRQRKVEIVTFERVRIGVTILDEDIFNVGETLDAEQFLCDQGGPDAQRVFSDPAHHQRRRILDADTDSGRFRRGLVGEGRPGAKNAGRADRGNSSNEIPASLQELHLSALCEWRHASVSVLPLTPSARA
jgi:hypothetical protein